MVLVCNHVSYMDALILGGAIRRPVRFVMDKQIAEMFGMRTFFRLAKTIPICSEKKIPKPISVPSSGSARNFRTVMRCVFSPKGV